MSPARGHRSLPLLYTSHLVDLQHWLIVPTELLAAQPLLPHMPKGQLLESFFSIIQILVLSLNHVTTASFALLFTKFPGLPSSTFWWIVLPKAYLNVHICCMLYVCISTYIHTSKQLYNIHILLIDQHLACTHKGPVVHEHNQYWLRTVIKICDCWVRRYFTFSPGNVIAYSSVS